MLSSLVGNELFDWVFGPSGEGMEKQTANGSYHVRVDLLVLSRG